MHILSIPVVESFLDAPAIRSGPHPLPYRAFSDCPWPIRWVAYWYRAHAFCAEYDCRCQATAVEGDGRCFVAYADGLYGCYDLLHRDGLSALDWSGVSRGAPREPWTDAASRARRVEGATFPDFVPHEAVFGLRSALDYASALGWAPACDADGRALGGFADVARRPRPA